MVSEDLWVRPYQMVMAKLGYRTVVALSCLELLGRIVASMSIYVHARQTIL